MSDPIRVTYRTIDRFSKSRSFKTIAGARAFAGRCVGKTPEVSSGFNYAVSYDGVGKITANIPVRELFPDLSEEA